MVADALSRRMDHKPTPPPTLTALSMSSLIPASVLSDIRQSYALDPLCTVILAKADPSPYVVHAGMIYHHQQVYVPHDPALKTRLLREAHDIPVSGHVGVAKTADLLTRHYYWPRMHAAIKDYVTSCLTCQQNKPSNALPIGLLYPLPVPEQRWQVVTMDLITQLPRTAAGHDAIVVFVDKYSKMVHYAPTLRLSMPLNSPSCSFNMLFVTMVSQHPSYPIVIHVSLPTFGVHCGHSWGHDWQCQLHIIHRRMDRRKGQIEH